MTEAEAQFAERLASDLEHALGEGMIVAAVEIETDERTIIRLAYLVEGQVRAVEVTGATPADAYREAMRAAADLRLAGAWWQIVGPS
jgi:UDP-3-O-[3-hydroxymyristoyl] glucosamine N-acyltransferase